MLRNDPLSRRKLRVLEQALGTSTSLSRLAHISGIGRTSLYRWLKNDPEFGAELEAAIEARRFLDSLEASVELTHHLSRKLTALRGRFP